MAADASTTRPISNGPTDPSQRNSSVESESRTAVDVEEPTPSPVHTSSTIKSRWRMGILNVPDATDVPGRFFVIQVFKIHVPRLTVTRIRLSHRG